MPNRFAAQAFRLHIHSAILIHGRGLRRVLSVMVPQSQYSKKAVLLEKGIRKIRKCADDPTDSKPEAVARAARIAEASIGHGCGAAAVGRSPSAISEALAQLRGTFHDPLLVRAQGGMVLTPRALELIEPVEELWSQLERLLAGDKFAPHEAERQFVIAATDFHILTLGPWLVSLIDESAPGFDFRFVEIGLELNAQLVSREVDFAILPDLLIGRLTPSRTDHFFVRQDHTVVLMREGHPLSASAAITHAQLMAVEQVALFPSWETAPYRRATMAFRRDLPVRIGVPQVTALPWLICGTDRVALGPPQLVNGTMGNLGLIQRPLAEPMHPVRSALTWGRVFDADPAHRWFRERVRAAVSEQGERPMTT